MATRQHQPARTIGRVAIAVAAAVAVCLPAGYFGLSYQAHISAMRTEAQLNAMQTTRYIAVNPELWRFQALRLKELIETDHTDTELPERRHILDASGQVIATDGEPLARPVLSIRAPLFDAGRTVGYFEVSRSFRPLLLRTGLVALLGLGFAAAVFGVLKTLPLRALDRALDSLRQSQQLFQKAFHAIPDPVIIARAHDGHILDVNESFVRLTGYRRDEAVGRSAAELALWPEADARTGAAGRLDAMLSARPCRSVDAAAAQLLVREAGGVVAFQGRELESTGLGLDERYRVAAGLDAEMLATVLEAQAQAPDD